MTSSPDATAGAAVAASSPGELKQAVLRLYNAANQAVWGAGVREQQVDLLEDRILVVALHQRVPALASLDATRRSLTREVDVALMDQFKQHLARALQEELGLGVRAVLKDYDPDTQLACTVAVLSEPLSFPSTHHPRRGAVPATR